MDKLILPNGVLLGEVSKIIAEGKDVAFTPKGNSMLPFIYGGKDSVIITAAPSVKVGDIVLVKIDGKYLLHRIYEIDGDKLTLMGDGNIRGTEACMKSDVVGRVREIRREGKAIVPGDGSLWRKLLPYRRYILGIYRRAFPSRVQKLD